MRVRLLPPNQVETCFTDQTATRARKEGAPTGSGSLGGRPASSEQEGTDSTGLKRGLKDVGAETGRGRASPQPRLDGPSQERTRVLRRVRLTFKEGKEVVDCFVEEESKCYYCGRSWITRGRHMVRDALLERGEPRSVVGSLPFPPRTPRLEGRLRPTGSPTGLTVRRGQLLPTEEQAGGASQDPDGD